MEIYFGDLHNHCNISYGFGSLENALAEARNHLDFCTVTGHALWPDIYESNKETAFIVDYHKTGFKKLESRWEYINETISEANKTDEFITLQSYEMHSSQYGDHHILSCNDKLQLHKGETPADIVSMHGDNVVAIPHHIAYTPGYRGISWNDFDDSISPVVEVYSKHGCGVSDESHGQYMHTMGPRDGRNTVYEGLRQGKKFGFTASTDHHAGYPGSYGDGITAVLADELSRDSIWDAITSRRVYALTGDRIRCGFSVDGKSMGSETESSNSHTVKFHGQAQDFIEKAVIYKNLVPIKIMHREDFAHVPVKIGKYKIRIETGWGRKTTPYKWNNKVSITDGRIIQADPCFRGQNVLAPKEGVIHQDSVNKLSNKITSGTQESVVWECTTFKNPTPKHPGTCAVVLEIEGSLDTVLKVELNGQRTETNISELMKYGISGHLQKHNSEAYIIHKAVPEDLYNFSLESKSASKSGDYFHAEIHQTNGQSAWISPIFIK